MNGNNTRHAYNIVRNLNRKQTSKQSVINDKNGNPISEDSEVAERWKEYCRELYNTDLGGDERVTQHPEYFNIEDEPPILEAEVRHAIQRLPSNKSPGGDNIPGEIIKVCKDEMVKPLTRICNQILKTKTWPKQWTSSIIIPLPKKGNLRESSNYLVIQAKSCFEYFFKDCNQE